MDLKYPVLVVNFKSYKESTGKNAVVLAKTCEKVALETKTNIIVAVEEADLFRVSQAVSIPVFSQHIDPITYGAHTGQDVPEALKENGAQGCLLNHSEDRFRMDMIEESITRAKESGLIILACANDAKSAKAIAAFSPDIIAVEPPELIGSGVSVSTTKPEVIKNTIKEVYKVAKIPVLCGAGITNKQDVVIALKLGSKGLLVASAITKAQNPEEKIRELVSGFR
jgi:triosephosphate isomerase (TIM)